MVFALTVIILIAALAIDVSSWYTKHHQAQVTADSAALAAANYMSTTPNASPATATTQATTYAADNGLAVDPSNVIVNTGNSTVTVTPQTTGPLLFAGITLSSAPAISARAVAGWLGGECTSGGSGCAFAFGADNVCSSNTGVTDPDNKNGVFNHGVTIAKAGTGTGEAITGDVISASNITTNVNGNPSFASTAVYPATDTVSGAACSGPTPGTPSKPYSSAIQEPVASSYPVDYSKIYPACSPTSTSPKFGAVTCDANGYPNYCTAAEENTPTVSTVVTNAIYCDAGSGTLSDPSTWNGAITVTAPGGNATYIAGSVNLQPPSNNTYGPAAGNNLLAYAAECNASTPLPSTCPATHTTTGVSVAACEPACPAIYMTSSGNVTIAGDFFAPAGVIDSYFTGSPTMTGFLEGWDVAYQSKGTVIGQGPPVSPTGTFLPDWLAQ